MMGRKKKKQAQSLSFAIPAFQATRGYAIASTGAVPYETMQVPTPIKDRGLSIEPIVGIRAFQVETDAGGTLLLSYNGTGWPPYEALDAVCENNPFADHEVPAEGCMCGIYAWTPDAAKAGHCVTQLQGEVYLWGEVLICELGYRAEFAYPKSLTITAKPTRSVMRIRDSLAESYGIPVSIVDPPAPVESVELNSWNQFVVHGGFAAPAVPGYQIPPPKGLGT